MDNDDYIESDMYEFLYNLLLQNKADVSCCNIYKYDFTKKEYVSDINLQVEGVITFNETLNIKQGNYVWNKLYGKNLIKNYRFDGFAEDIKFNFEVLQKAKRIVYSKQAKYYYYDNINSASRVKKHSKYLYATELIKVYEQIIEYCKKNNLKKAVQINRWKKFYWIISLLFMISEIGCEQEEILNFLLRYVRKEIGYWLFGDYGIKTKLFLLLGCINFDLAVKMYRLFKK